jgi:hypothetical protein
MGLLQFIASLVNSLAWPAAASVMVVILRRPIAYILRRGQIKRLKAGPGGLELEYFDEKLEEANEALAETPTEAASLTISLLPEIAMTRDDFIADMKQLADVAPSAAILESFARLEKILRESVESASGVEVEPRRPISVRTLARRALDLRLITQSEFAALNDLAVLRNIVAHGGAAAEDIDADRALGYAQTVRQLITSVLLKSRGNDSRSSDDSDVQFGITHE